MMSAASTAMRRAGTHGRVPEAAWGSASGWGVMGILPGAVGRRWAAVTVAMGTGMWHVRYPTSGCDGPGTAARADGVSWLVGGSARVRSLPRVAVS